MVLVLFSEVLVEIDDIFPCANTMEGSVFILI